MKTIIYFFFFKQKTAYEVPKCLEFRRVLFRSHQIAYAKSILGLMALDYNKPVKVVTEDSHFIKQIEKWAV